MDVAVLFRDRVIRGQMSLEQFARELIRMDGSSPRGPCLGADEGARLPAPVPREPEPQSLFVMEGDPQ